jgi:hypothetical protein
VNPLAVMLVAGLAAARVVNLVQLDTIGDKLRAWLTDRLLGAGWLGGKAEYLLFGCPFCLGFWVSGAAVLAVRSELPIGWGAGAPALAIWFGAAQVCGAAAALRSV